MTKQSIRPDEYQSKPPPRLYLRRLARKPQEKRRDCEVRLLDELLAEHYGRSVSLRHYPTGQPYVEEQPNDFISISHSDSWALLAISVAPIGVDIEDIASQVERVESKFAHPRELDKLQAIGHRTLALHLLWSAKEAAYKLVNPPSASLKEFTLSQLDYINSQQRIAFCAIRNTSDLEIELLLSWTETYVMAVATY